MQSRHMAITVPLQVMSVSTGYAAALGWLERKFPSIKPDHIWAEVAGGVLVTLIPVMLAAHRKETSPDNETIVWQDYEGAVWRSFCAAAVPIILWQLGESVVRRTELLSYSYNTHRKNEGMSVPFAGERGSAAGGQERSTSLLGEVVHYLRNAQTSAEQARVRMSHNPGLAQMMMSEAQHAAARALTCIARNPEQTADTLTLVN